MIGETQLDALREQVERTMSPYRFRHTAEVEKMVTRLAALYAPEQTLSLRAAALLHDITKEANTEEQLALCGQYGVTLTDADKGAPKTLHAMTAAAVIPGRYPAFAEKEILCAVRWHTTGRAGMGLGEWLLYLADYIDLSRTFPDCVALRAFFWGAEPEKMEWEERLEHLTKTLIRSLDLTVRALIEEGTPISPDSVNARNELITAGLQK